MASEKSTGLVYSDRYLQHNTNPYRLVSGKTLPFVEAVDHPSNPRLVERTKKLLDYTGLSKELKPRRTLLRRAGGPDSVPPDRTMSSASGRSASRVAGTPGRVRRSVPIPTRSRCWPRAG